MVVTLILLGLLATFGGATFGVPDSLAPPGYFDGGDGDDALWLASEGLPAIVLLEVRRITRAPSSWREEIVMFGLGTQELMLILAIALVLFGGSKIPELGKSLGQAIREFKRGVETPDPRPEAKEEAGKGGKPSAG
jgi:sec-independent protein translocase protein TatA